MSNSEEMKLKVIDIARENGWSVYVTFKSENNYTYEFSQFSTDGRYYYFYATMQDNDIHSLIRDIKHKYNKFDYNKETYVRITDGVCDNGWKDGKELKQRMLNLYKVLNNVDWSIYRLSLMLALTNEQQEELEQHLKFNGYNVYWEEDDVIQVDVDEVDYIKTILEDRGIKYCIL